MAKNKLHDLALTMGWKLVNTDETYSNYEYSESDPPEVTHQGLADFIKDWIIVSTLEDYDYNGDEKE